MSNITGSAPSVSKRLAGPDHLRALAIILVFFWHYRQHGSPAWVDAIGLFGWTGVDLFFVLSGYLIGGQLMKNMQRGRQISFKDFYLRRLFRIIPAYAVVLVLYYTIPPFRERGPMLPLWKFVTFTQNFGLDFSKGGTFSHAWSLCIEEQFYLLLPLILMALVAAKQAHKGAYLLCVLFIAGFIARYASWQHFMQPIIDAGDNEHTGIAYFEWIYYPTYNRLDGLLAGVGIAALQRFRPMAWQRITAYGNWLLLASLALLTAAYFLTADLLSFGAAIFGYPLVSVAYGVLVIASLSPSCILYKYPLRISSIIATLAYSIYLSHKQLNHIVREQLAPYHMAADSLVLFLLCTAVALLGGIVLHLAIERPFLKLRDRIL